MLENTRIDIAITNGTVLPMGGSPPLPGGMVTIAGGVVVAVGGPDEAAIRAATRVIDASGCAVLPGLVDCHTHIASNMLLRGLLEDVQLFEWLETMWRLKRNFDPETLYWANLAGLVEMVRSGITCFNEHFDAYAVEPQIEALDRVQLRATLGYGFADRGLYASITDWSWRTLRNFGDVLAGQKGRVDGRVQLALSPHAVYSCGEEMWRLVRDVADTYKVIIHTHVAEGIQEMRYMAETYGTTPVRWLASLDVLGPDVTAAHCTQLDAEDIAILAETGTKIAHCPVCNAKLVSGTMNLRDVLAAGITVGLATDGPASHNTLDLFEEMKFAALIHKDRTADPEFLKTHEVLELATSGAARAMHRPELGVLAPGHPADVIVVDLDRPHTLPVYDAAAALVYSSRADDVRYTIVGGEVLLDAGQVVGVDEEEVRRNFRERALALRDRSL